MLCEPYCVTFNDLVDLLNNQIAHSCIYLYFVNGECEHGTYSKYGPETKRVTSRTRTKRTRQVRMRVRLNVSLARENLVVFVIYVYVRVILIITFFFLLSFLNDAIYYRFLRVLGNLYNIV